MSGLLSASIFSLWVIMGIVISENSILEAIPIGATSEEVESYFRGIDVQYQFISRESDNWRGRKYEYKENDIGHFITLVENAQIYFWLPSFGQSYRIRVGISDEGIVSGVEVRPQVKA